jgi:hypothetical protein
MVYEFVERVLEEKRSGQWEGQEREEGQQKMLR